MLARQLYFNDGRKDADEVAAADTIGTEAIVTVLPVAFDLMTWPIEGFPAFPSI